MKLLNTFNINLMTTLFVFSFSFAVFSAYDSFPNPPKENVTTKGRLATAVFAGGCFWGIEGVFEELNGVKDAVSGYSGGEASTAKYDLVSSGTTGHAESVQVTYDPAVISYGMLLKVFFTVAHDPTELNFQGPDQGTQYRSAIFYTTPEQKRIAEEYIAIISKAKIYRKPIVTTVLPLNGFYIAESYHQNFMRIHPDNPYIEAWDIPKLESLRVTFPELLKRK
jgi:peptide-methionine (S)-S-oxide reductase